MEFMNLPSDTLRLIFGNTGHRLIGPIMLLSMIEVRSRVVLGTLSCY